MAILDQINKVNCTIGDFAGAGTGNEACQFVFDQTSAIILADRSYVQTDVISIVNLQIAQQKEEIFVISEIEKFTQIDVAPIETTTEGTGFKSVDAEYPYEFEFEFKNKGINFWKALRKFNSTNRHSVAFVDKEGNVLMTLSTSGAVKLFSASMIYTGQLMFKQGTAPEMAKMKIQLRSVKEMENSVWVTAEESSLDVESLDGWNDILLTASPLAVAATTLTVKATLSDKSHFVGGLVTGDFLVQRNGVTVVHTAVVANSATQTYAITIPAATAGTYTVTTKNTYGKQVVLAPITGVLYRANTATVIVA